MLVLLSSAVASANPLSRAWKERIVDPRISLIAELKKRGLRYGYATYWNASAISVLSGQSVRIRQIKLDGKKVGSPIAPCLQIGGIDQMPGRGRRS